MLWRIWRGVPLKAEYEFGKEAIVWRVCGCLLCGRLWFLWYIWQLLSEKVLAITTSMSGIAKSMIGTKNNIGDIALVANLRALSNLLLGLVGDRRAR